MSWKSVKLGEICTLHYGKSLQNYSDHLPEEGSARVFGTNGPIGWTKEPLTKQPTIIVGRKGAYRGVHISNGPSWTIDTAYFTSTDPSVVDLQWFFYRLRLLDINSMNSGAAIPSTKREDFYAASIILPDLPTQQRIAGILSAYDDLIENNRRRIGLLEQAARLLYREWFVHLRFPGHETAKIVDGLPEGWERKRLGSVTTKLGSGATPKGGENAYEQFGITLIRSLNVYDYSFHDDGLVYLNDDQAKKLTNVTVEGGDVLLNITGASVARCCMVPDRHLPARVNQHVMIIRVDPLKASGHFVLHAINSHQNKERLLSIARAGGATREALTKDTMAGFEMVFPSAELMADFHAKALALHGQAEKLSAHISLLTRARDLLLPRLMDGRIPV